jgi:hypothetical protein
MALDGETDIRNDYDRLDGNQDCRQNVGLVLHEYVGMVCS